MHLSEMFFARPIGTHRSAVLSNDPPRSLGELTNICVPASDFSQKIELDMSGLIKGFGSGLWFRFYSRARSLMMNKNNTNTHAAVRTCARARMRLVKINICWRYAEARCVCVCVLYRPVQARVMIPDHLNNECTRPYVNVDVCVCKRFYFVAELLCSAPNSNVPVYFLVAAQVRIFLEMYAHVLARSDIVHVNFFSLKKHTQSQTPHTHTQTLAPPNCICCRCIGVLHLST